MRTEHLDYALAKRRELERKFPPRAVRPLSTSERRFDAEIIRLLDTAPTRQPSALKDSVIPWWRSQWEEGV